MLAKRLPSILPPLTLGESLEELDNLFQVLCSVNFQVIYNSGFPRVLPGYDDSFKTEFSGFYGNGQCAFNGLPDAYQQYRHQHGTG